MGLTHFFETLIFVTFISFILAPAFRLLTCKHMLWANTKPQIPTMHVSVTYVCSCPRHVCRYTSTSDWRFVSCSEQECDVCRNIVRYLMITSEMICFPVSLPRRCPTLASGHLTDTFWDASHASRQSQGLIFVAQPQDLLLHAFIVVGYYSRCK